MADQLEIKIQGRGGQGVVTTSRLLARAYLSCGKEVLAWPTFGAERRGAPVAAFLRVSDEPISLRSQIYEADHLIIMDYSLFESGKELNGLKQEGLAVVNCPGESAAPRFGLGQRAVLVDGWKIVQSFNLGSTGTALLGTALLGSYSRVAGAPGLKELLGVLDREQLPMKDENLEAARLGYAGALIIG